jgi:hypothetical protein
MWRSAVDDPLDSIRAELVGIAADGRLRTRPLIDSPDGRLISWRADGKRLKLVNWARKNKDTHYLVASPALRAS